MTSGDQHSGNSSSLGVSFACPNPGDEDRKRDPETNDTNASSGFPCSSNFDDGAIASDEKQGGVAKYQDDAKSAPPPEDDSPTTDGAEREPDAGRGARSDPSSENDESGELWKEGLLRKECGVEGGVASRMAPKPVEHEDDHALCTRSFTAKEKSGDSSIVAGGSQKGSLASLDEDDTRRRTKASKGPKPNPTNTSDRVKESGDLSGDAGREESGNDATVAAPTRTKKPEGRKQRKDPPEASAKKVGFSGGKEYIYILPRPNETEPSHCVEEARDLSLGVGRERSESAAVKALTRKKKSKGRKWKWKESTITMATGGIVSSPGVDCGTSTVDTSTRERRPALAAAALADDTPASAVPSIVERLSNIEMRALLRSIAHKSPRDVCDAVKAELTTSGAVEAGDLSGDARRQGSGNAAVKVPTRKKPKGRKQWKDPPEASVEKAGLSGGKEYVSIFPRDTALDTSEASGTVVADSEAGKMVSASAVTMTAGGSVASPGVDGSAAAVKASDGKRPQALGVAAGGAALSSSPESMAPSIVERLSEVEMRVLLRSIARESPRDICNAVKAKSTTSCGGVALSLGFDGGIATTANATSTAREGQRMPMTDSNRRALPITASGTRGKSSEAQSNRTAALPSEDVPEPIKRASVQAEESSLPKAKKLRADLASKPPPRPRAVPNTVEVRILDAAHRAVASVVAEYLVNETFKSGQPERAIRPSVLYNYFPFLRPAVLQNEIRRRRQSEECRHGGGNGRVEDISGKPGKATLVNDGNLVGADEPAAKRMRKCAEQSHCVEEEKKSAAGEDNPCRRQSDGRKTASSATGGGGNTDVIRVYDYPSHGGGNQDTSFANTSPSQGRKKRNSSIDIKSGEASRDRKLDEKLVDLAAFKKIHGHCCVPVTGEKGNTELGKWVRMIRREYRKMNRGEPSYLNPQRLAKLAHAGVFRVLWSVERSLHPVGGTDRGLSNVPGET